MSKRVNELENRVHLLEVAVTDITDILKTVLSAKMPVSEMLRLSAESTAEQATSGEGCGTSAASS